VLPSADGHEEAPTVEGVGGERPLAEEPASRPAVIRNRAVVGQKRIQVLSLSEVHERVVRIQGSITVENGIYRVGDEVYRQPGEGPRADLRSLADTVLKDSSVRTRPRGVRVKKLPFSGSGIEYDRYLEQFDKPERYRTQFMGLVEMSKQVDAVCAALFVREEGGTLSPFLTLGLTESSMTTFRFDEGESIWRSFFARKRTLVINDEIQKVSQLKNKLSEEDLKYIRRSIFMPAQFKKRDAVLFLGFAGEKPIQINRLLSRMNVSLLD